MTTHRLSAPDLQLPYTVSGYVWTMDAVRSLGTTWAAERVIVDDIVAQVKWEIIQYTDMYKLLIASMSDYGQRVPIRVTQDMLRLRDGMHRVAIADMLGWKTMVVDTEQTAWHEWNESEQGQLYMNMWRQRLGYFRG